MMCQGGPLDGEEVSRKLGHEWPYVLTPFYGMDYADRILGWYVRGFAPDTYEWIGPNHG